MCDWLSLADGSERVLAACSRRLRDHKVARSQQTSSRLQVRLGGVSQGGWRPVRSPPTVQLPRGDREGQQQRSATGAEMERPWQGLPADRELRDAERLEEGKPFAREAQAGDAEHVQQGRARSRPRTAERRRVLE